MNTRFADTYYFIALLNPADPDHQRIREFTLASRDRLVTTGLVLAEVANHLSYTRSRSLVQPFFARLASDPRAEIVPADRAMLERGLEYYHARPDKEWSLTDCVSFLVMTDRELTEALTADHHFEQAGFAALLKE